jgi:hypothetical protein
VVVEGTGVLEGNFGASNQQFQLNNPLLERIGDFVRVADRSVKMGPSVQVQCPRSSGVNEASNRIQGSVEVLSSPSVS